MPSSRRATGREVGRRLMELALHPLPGSQPYENLRPITVSAGCGGLCLLEILCRRFPHIDCGEWTARCADGRFLGHDGRVLAALDRLPAGTRFIQRFPDCTEPPVSTDIRVVHEDNDLLVLDKPAPLPAHPSGRFNRNTLRHFLSLAAGETTLLPVHRLDANTTGLVVFAKSPGAAHALQCQFHAGTVVKIYQVRVIGHPTRDAFSVRTPIAALPGPTGTHDIDPERGRPAFTGFRVRRRDADGTSLLDARLGTGRTNQIRVHLWRAGHPVCGDPAYLSGDRIGSTQTLDPGAPPMCLHALHLAFRHPGNAHPLEFISTRNPDWAAPI